MMWFLRRQSAFVSDKALAAGVAQQYRRLCAVPLTGNRPASWTRSTRNLKGVTDRIVEMIGELSQ